MRKLTKIEFIRKGNVIHNNIYSYHKTNYKTAREKVTITCPIHGDFEQIASLHLKGRGCQKCGKARQHPPRDTTESFIAKAKLKHGNTYTYDKTIYTTSDKPIIVTCPIHGDFSQRAQAHLLYGCRKCANTRKNNWDLQTWKTAAMKSYKFNAFCFYIIKCTNDTETFIKAGKTFTTLTNRYPSKMSLPYNWEIVKVRYGTAEYISKLEKHFHKFFKKYKYMPKIPFGGKYECFTLTLE